MSSEAPRPDDAPSNTTERVANGHPYRVGVGDGQLVVSARGSAGQRNALVVEGGGVSSFVAGC
jgi:hypothetical protein